MISTAEYLEISKKYPFQKEYDGCESDKNLMIEYNKYYIDRYPFLRPRNVWSDDEVEDFDYSYSLYDDVPNGWRLAFGDEMLEEFRKELVKFDFLDEYRVVQIKEKYGSLRWYGNGAPIGKLSETFKVLEKKRCDNTQTHYEWIKSLGLDNDKYYIKLDHTENYESIMDENFHLKPNADEIKKRNDEKAIDVYHVYDVLERCKIYDIINKYENLSYKTCISCGKPSTKMTTGWIMPVCDDCYKK